MALAESDEVDAKLIGQHRLLKDIADHLRMRQYRAGGACGDIAKGVQSKFEQRGH
jgi:hypothetical protein